MARGRVSVWVRRGVLALVAMGLVLAHVLFWYSPRARPAAPDAQDAPFELFSNPAYPVAIWLAYPHQNVGALAGSVEELETLVAAAARLAELPPPMPPMPPMLPGFGPFSVPPARELAVGYDPETEAFLVAARIYPLLSVVARLAGWVASNPWLAGGEVELGSRRARVEWQRSLWTLSSGQPLGDKASGARVVPEMPGASLAFVRLPGRSSLFAAGVYRVEQQEEDLVIRLWDPAAGTNESPSAGSSLRLALPGRPPLGADIAVLVTSGVVNPVAAPPGALVLLRPPADGVLRFPGGAVVYPAGGPRLELPGEKIASTLGLRLYQSQAQGEGAWDLVALDARSFEVARALAPDLDDLLVAETQAGATFSLWINPAAALAFVASLRRTVEAIPLVAADEASYWRDVETLLAPLSGYAALSLAAADDPRRLEIRLWSQDAAADL